MIDKMSNSYIKKWLSQKSRFYEVLNGLALTVLLAMCVVIFYQGISLKGILTFPFLIILLTITPLNFGIGLWETVSLFVLLFSVLRATLKYQKGPWLRWSIAVIYSIWLYIGVLNLGSMY